MSIKPKWVEKIVSGEKTIEVRKTAPKEVPFKVYIYCTYGGGRKGSEALYLDAYGNVSRKANGTKWINGKVIGEFICNEVSEYRCKKNKDGASEFTISEKDFKDMAIDGFDLFDYAGDKDIYGIHITDPILYDKPKELREFRKPCGDCLGKCKGEHYERCPWQTVNRPPQTCDWSWLQGAHWAMQIAAEFGVEEAECVNTNKFEEQQKC